MLDMTVTNPTSTVQTRISVEDYLKAEEKAEFKNEYYDGEVVAMSGGSPEHSLVIANCIRELGIRLKGKSCRVYESNLHVAVKRRYAYLYPDLTIICGQAEFDPIQKGKRRLVTNPSVVVEVLSPSTERHDRVEKFELYRELESLKEYVLISQDSPLVEVFERFDDGGWRFDVCKGIDATMRLRSVGIEVPLAEIYAGVEFVAESSEPTEPFHTHPN